MSQATEITITGPKGRSLIIHAAAWEQNAELWLMISSHRHREIGTIKLMMGDYDLAKRLALAINKECIP